MYLQSNQANKNGVAQMIYFDLFLNFGWTS